MTVVHCEYDRETRSGTAGADARKVKGNIHWLSARHAIPAEVRLYDRLFKVPFPGARNPYGNRGGDSAEAAAHAARIAGEDEMSTEITERNYLEDLNPASKHVLARLRRAVAGERGA